jgi:probable non-F420 flavinoid oxidoreductase
MTRFGFHASHEEVDPRTLLRDVQLAEQAGFAAAMCSDHISPWTSTQGQSGFAWSWLGAALATTSLSFGVVTAPGQRYHPAVHAQAIGTLAQMFPGRFWAALGSGQALNEHVTGDPWPRKEVRNARLLECVDVERRLLAGEEVTREGLVTVDRARVWSLPDEPPPLLAAAVTPETARWAGSWADGLITVNQPVETLREVVAAFREGGGEGKPAHLQVHVSHEADDDTARRVAVEMWGPVILGSGVGWELATPAEFEQVARFVREDDMHPHVLASGDAGRHAAWLRELADVGFDDVYVHHVGHDQERFLAAYGEKVLPELAAA